MMLALFWRLWQGSPLPTAIGGRRDVPIVSTGQRPDELSPLRAASLATVDRPNVIAAAQRTAQISGERAEALSAGDRSAGASSARPTSLSTAVRRTT